jgi:Holliday junction resolvase RusA-like endonuclease
MQMPPQPTLCKPAKEIVIDLPMPPSLNTLWRRGRNRQTGAIVHHLNATYKKWKQIADVECLRQRVGKGWHTIMGAFEAHMAINRKKLRKNADIDNRFKAVGDWAQQVGLIENDKNLQKLVIEFGEAPLGIRLTLKPFAL